MATTDLSDETTDNGSQPDAAVTQSEESPVIEPTDPVKSLTEPEAPASEEPVVDTPAVPESGPEGSAAPMSEPVTPPETAAPAPVQAPPASKKARPKWFFGAVAAAFVLLVAGGAYGYFGIYMQTPENIWKTSLKNTRQGLDAYVDKGLPDKKGAKFNGSFKMTAPLSADGSFTGSTYEQAADMKLDVGTSGVRASLAVKTVPVEGSETPDVYLNVSGIKGLAGLVSQDPGLNTMIDSLDGKWLVADHTLLDEVQKNLNDGATSDLTKETPEQLKKDLEDIEKKVAAVVNDRLLTDDDAKAVVIIKEKRAKEDFKGRKSQRLRVQVRKAQLHDFAVAMKDALKTTKMNKWLVGDTKKSFEEALNFDDLLKSIDSANYDDATADAWVDIGYKTIRNIRIYQKPGDTKNYVDLMFDYQGGDDYPFLLHAVAPESPDGDMEFSLGLTLNRTTDKAKLTFDIKQKSKGGAETATANGSFEVTPSDEKISVEKPAGATNIVNLLGGFLGQAQNELKVVNPVNSSFLDDAEL
jgi:hypothetical protein